MPDQAQRGEGVSKDPDYGLFSRCCHREFYRGAIPASVWCACYTPLMDLSNLPPAMVSQFAGMVEDYILGSRTKYGSNAVSLSPEQRTAMLPFFPAELLDQSRLVRLRDSRVQDPPFYGMARMMGIRNLPSFAATSAVTFVDVIVSHEDFTNSLLFHELVHAVQYSLLGAKEFARRYVNGFLQGGSSEEIPLEKSAYQLESRFSANVAQVFSVADEVKQAITEGKL